MHSARLRQSESLFKCQTIFPPVPTPQLTTLSRGCTSDVWITGETTFDERVARLALALAGVRLVCSISKTNQIPPFTIAGSPYDQNRIGTLTGRRCSRANCQIARNPHD